MKFQMNGADFKNIIDRIGSLVLKKPILEYLKSIRFVTKNDHTVCVYATDAESYVHIEAEALVLEYGQTWVDYDDLKKITTINENIMITDESNVFDVRNRKKSFELASHDYSEYWLEEPTINSKRSMAALDESKLLKYLSNIYCMTSVGDPNKLLCSFYFDLPNKKIVALDSHRIGIAKIDGEFNSNVKGLVIDGSIYPELKSIVGKSKEKKVGLYSDNKYACFVGEDYTYIKRLVEGEYYNYEKMIDDITYGSQYKYTVDKEELKKVSKEYSKFIHVGDKTPMIFYNDENGVMATGISSGKYKTSDLIESVESEYGLDREFFVGCNPKFIVDACNLFDGKIEIMGRYSVWEPFILQDDNYVCLILPINIDTSDVGYVKKQVA